MKIRLDRRASVPTIVITAAVPRWLRRLLVAAGAQVSDRCPGCGQPHA